MLNATEKGRTGAEPLAAQARGTAWRKQQAPGRRAIWPLLACGALMASLGGCPVADLPAPESEPDPQFAGTWVVADADTDETFATIAFASDGTPVEVCSLAAAPLSENESYIFTGELDHVKLDGVAAPRRSG